MLDNLFAGRMALKNLSREAVGEYGGYRWEPPPKPEVKYQAGGLRVLPSPYMQHPYVRCASKEAAIQAKLQVATMAIDASIIE
jgi:hypothetical protein